MMSRKRIFQFVLLIVVNCCIHIMIYTYKATPYGIRENTTFEKDKAIQVYKDNNQKETKFNAINDEDINADMYTHMTGGATSLIRNGIFWSDIAESFVPKGLSLADSLNSIKNLRAQNVEFLASGSYKMCGVSKAGVLIVEDGTTLCAKYKRKQRSVYAEALAYYVSRLLQMDNVPEVFLASTDPNSGRWKAVNSSALGWKDNETVALVTWLTEGGFRTWVPEVIYEAHLNGHPITSSTINKSTFLKANSSQISELIQWGSIIIFDSLIGNTDRLIKLNEYPKGNVIEDKGKLHNSIKSSSGKIWIIDHESTFLYQFKNNIPEYNYARTAPVYDKMLRTMCVFQYSLVEGLQRLSEHPSPFKGVWDYARSLEPLMETMPHEYQSEIFAKLFDSRLKRILEWIQQCRHISIEVANVK